MAENIGAEVRRDTELERRMLEAVIADRNAQPRNQQLQVGPSEVGGCRELLRAGLFESESLAEPESHWATAAHVGSVMGADLESIFGRQLSALEQQRITALFERLGVSISGAIDLLFLAEGHVTDLKSTDDIGGVLYDLKKNASAIETLLSLWREGLLFRKRVETPDGGYELTQAMLSKMSKLSYYVQVAIYVMGAIQLGILEADAEGRLVFYDRSGSYQEFVALVLTHEELELFYEIGQHRLEQVVFAQEGYEKGGGNPAIIAHLRDMTPSYCFSPKVMCPRRVHCWGGSDWTTDERISAEHAKAVERYIIGRDMAKLGEGMKRAARAELEGISGILPDGRMVTWVRGGTTINVVETTGGPMPMGQVLDTALATMEVEATRERTPEEQVEDRTKLLKGMRKPQLTLIATAFDPDVKGTIAELIEFILDREFPWRTGVTEAQIAEAHEKSVAEGLVPPDAGKLVIPDADAPSGITDESTAEFVEAAVEAMSKPLDESATEWTGEPQASDTKPEQTMIWIGDVSFRCQCGTNVFTKHGEHEFTCNGCGTRYDDGTQNDLDAPEPEAEIVATGGELVATQQYEEGEVLRRRQALFGMTLDELSDLASDHGLATNVPRNFMIQAILDAEFKPVPGRGWAPNGAGTTGDPQTDRLRQMQYDADPAMRRNYEGEQQ